MSLIKSLSRLLCTSCEFLIRAYRYIISPQLGDVCRFQPSCSTYAIEALRSHGFLRGIALTVWRVLRCNPYCCGGIDPVPASSLERKFFPIRCFVARLLGIFPPGAFASGKGVFVIPRQDSAKCERA